MWEDVILFAAVGSAAQVIDGALGRAYGVTVHIAPLGLVGGFLDAIGGGGAPW